MSSTLHRRVAHRTLLVSLVLLVLAGCMGDGDDEGTPTSIGDAAATPSATTSGSPTATADATREDANTTTATAVGSPGVPVLPSRSPTDETEPQRPTPKLVVTPAGSPIVEGTATPTPVPTWIPTVQAMLTATTLAEGWCLPETALPIIVRFVVAFNAGNREALLALLPDASASSVLTPGVATTLDAGDDPTLFYTFQIYYEEPIPGVATPDASLASDPTAAADWLLARHAAGEQWEMAGITFDEARQRRAVRIPEVSEAAFGVRLTSNDREPWTMMVIVQVNCDAELVLSWRMIETPLVGQWQ